MSEQQRVDFCKTSLARIEASLRDAPESWRSQITFGMTIIETLETTTFMQQARRTAEQIRMIEGLQQLTLHDPRSSNVSEILSWCSRQWLAIHERDPQSIEALAGIAQIWLSRAQPLLARIHRAENSSSSSDESSHNNGGGTPASTSMAMAQDEDAERRAGTADYVEVRGYLQPATEYLDRAVDAATAQRRLTGDLLTKVSLRRCSVRSIPSSRFRTSSFAV